MSQSATVTSVTEFQAWRAVREMQARRAPRHFLWSVPNLGMAMVVGFRPVGNDAAQATRLARTGR